MQDLNELYNLTNEAIAEIIDSDDRPDGPINWAVLSCKVAWVKIGYDRMVLYEVIITGAGPSGNEALKTRISAHLRECGWRGVLVVTEW